MADDEDLSQKTEEPTPRRLEEARRKGQVLSSREITHFLMLLAFTIFVIWAAPKLLHYAYYKLSFWFKEPALAVIGDNGVSPVELARKLLFDFVSILIGPLLLFALAIVLSNFLQHGFLVAPEAIKFDLSKISPLKGIKRLFSMRSFAEFIKAIVKIAVIGFAIYFAISSEISVLRSLHEYHIQGALAIIFRLVIKMLIAISSVMAVIAALDFVYQRYEYLKGLRMSRQELKEEYKQTEGSPEIKAKLRSLRNERARKRMMSAVPDADVIITNPTHFSVALKYDPATMAAPRVIAKGVDKVALKIREVAKEHEIPLVENPPLARALYDAVEIDQDIPFEHYRAVAEVISYVMGLRKRKAV